MVCAGEMMRTTINIDEFTNADEQELIRQSLNSGTPLGSDQFKKNIEKVSCNKIGYSVRGRPTKGAKTEG